MNHHPIAANMLKSFTETFAIVKKPKTLSILPQLGQVTLDLEFNDGIIREYIVNPVQVSLIFILFCIIFCFVLYCIVLSIIFIFYRHH